MDYYQLGYYLNFFFTKININDILTNEIFILFDKECKACLHELITFVNDIREGKDHDIVMNFKNLDIHHDICMSKTSNNNGWKGIWFRFFGKNTIHLTKVPVLKKLLTSDLGDIIFNCSISILGRNSNIPWHHGQTRVLYKYHLPLYVPKGDCGLKILTPEVEIIKWEVGNSYILDDTFEHTAWNHTNEDRYILLLDLYRPLGTIEEILVRKLVTYCEI